ncbi:MAG: hypothetical protein AAGA48_00130 [Myxococcota bacterium]
MTRRAPRAKRTPALPLVAALLGGAAGLGMLTTALTLYRDNAEQHRLENTLAQTIETCATEKEQLALSHQEDHHQNVRLWAMLDLTRAIGDVDGRQFGPARARLERAARHLRRGEGARDHALARRIESLELDAKSDIAMTKRALGSIRDTLEERLSNPPLAAAM